MGHLTRVVIFIVAIVTTVATSAQAPAFEVASIRQNRSGDGGTTLQLLPGGRFVAINANLRDLVTAAYQFEFQPFQFVGLEGWMISERFDVEGRAGREMAPDEISVRARALLVDRFRLVLRRETRSMPVYRMTVARSDRRLGPRLMPSAGACEPFRIGPAGLPVPPPSGAPQCGIRLTTSAIANGVHAVGTHVTLAQLTTRLLPYTQRRIVDETGLTGMFAVDIEFSDPRRLGQGDASAGALDAGVSMFTALQEQLGLKLDAATGPVDVLVIDSAQRPTEN